MFYFETKGPENQFFPFYVQAAGGLSVGYSVWETAIKEASEEANVTEKLAEKIIPAGSVSYVFFL